MLTLLLETIRDWVQSVLATFHSMYLGYITPQMFGAVGDGVHDDTQAIQQALNQGGTIYFPEGIYLINRRTEQTSNAILRVLTDNVCIIGEKKQKHFKNI